MKLIGSTGDEDGTGDFGYSYTGSGAFGDARRISSITFLVSVSILRD